MKYIVSYSGGLGSFAAAYSAVRQFGSSAVALVFCDTKTEDDDLYRFITETVAALGSELITLADGRDVWQVFKDVKFMGNSRIDPCSRILKRELFRNWMIKNHKPEEATLVMGISHGERHRMTNIIKNWTPYSVIAPLCDQDMTREQILDILDGFNIDPPRLYDMGFPHNNCGGFCIKTGQKQMKLLFEKLPDRYAHHEEQQEQLFRIIGKEHGFIRMTVDGELKYLTLKQFREFMQSNGQVDMFNESGCGCFI